MKINNWKIVALALSISLTGLMNNANAGLIEADIDADGSNKGYSIAGSTLEWMDFGENNHQSYDFVASQLGDGGEYEGWQLATSEQVYSLWYGAFIEFEHTANMFNLDHYGAVQLHTADKGELYDYVFDILGYNTLNSGRQTATGMFEGIDGLSYVGYTQRKGDNAKYFDSAHLYDQSNSTDTADSDYSTLLVRTIAVPEPSSLAIFTLAILGLLTRTRYLQSH